MGFFRNSLLGSIVQLDPRADADPNVLNDCNRRILARRPIVINDGIWRGDGHSRSQTVLRIERTARGGFDVATSVRLEALSPVQEVTIVTARYSRANACRERSTNKVSNRLAANVSNLLLIP